MRVLSFFEALKQALISRLGRAVLDDIEHGEKLAQLQRLRELEAIRDEARLRDETSVVVHLDRSLEERPVEVARDALGYFDSVISAADTEQEDDAPRLTESDPERPRERRKRRRRCE